MIKLSSRSRCFVTVSPWCQNITNKPENVCDNINVALGQCMLHIEGPTEQSGHISRHINKWYCNCIWHFHISHIQMKQLLFQCLLFESLAIDYHLCLTCIAYIQHRCHLQHTVAGGAEPAPHLYPFLSSLSQQGVVRDTRRWRGGVFPPCLQPPPQTPTYPGLRDVNVIFLWYFLRFLLFWDFCSTFFYWILFFFFSF